MTCGSESECVNHNMPLLDLNEGFTDSSVYCYNMFMCLMAHQYYLSYWCQKQLKLQRWSMLINDLRLTRSKYMNTVDKHKDYTNGKNLRQWCWQSNKKQALKFHNEHGWDQLSERRLRKKRRVNSNYQKIREWDRESGVLDAGTCTGREKPYKKTALIYGFMSNHASLKRTFAWGKLLSGLVRANSQYRVEWLRWHDESVAERGSGYTCHAGIYY